MQTFYNILVSDGAIALHFLLTVVLLGAVIIHAVQSGLKLDRTSRENADLKRQLTKLSDYSASSINDLQRQVDVQADAVRHAADCLAGTAQLDPGRFEYLSGAIEVPERSGSEFYVDLVGDDDQEPDLSMAESAFIEPDSDYIEPDVSMPMQASLVTMPVEEIEDGFVQDRFVQEHFAEERFAEERFADDPDTQQRADVMTRVLNRSRGI